MQVDENIIEVYTEYTDLNDVRTRLVDAGLPIANAERTMKPKSPYTPSEKDALSALKLMERLEDLDDVQKVYSNIDVTDELAERFAESV